ncbi:MAG: hypothetical protein L0215_15480 [Gemmataceae bacterium]|nr:hypothetical protein [Gemmataceae bacterium]
MKKSIIMLLLLLGLVVAAGLILTLEAAHVPDYRDQFQRLVGGFGLGPSCDLEPCEVSLDPRVGSACACDCGPIPGAIFLCPHHASHSIFIFDLEDNTSPERDFSPHLPQ